jgi:Zn-dependent metalloprotease
MTRVLSAVSVVFVLVVGAFYYPAVSTTTAAAVVATQGIRTVLVVGDGSASQQRATASTIESMIGAGQLRLIDRREDPLVPGRVHSRYQQAYNGLPVLGADVTVQRSGPQIITAMGIIFDGLALDTMSPVLAFTQASRVMALNGVRLLDSSAPLSILPSPDGSVSLVYTSRDGNGYTSFVNANTGVEMLRINEFQRQSAVVPGTGGLGDQKKVSGSIQGTNIVALDALRPPAIETHDLQGNLSRVEAVASGLTPLTTGDLARQTGATWTDSAVVDAHVHAGFVYDYYYRRFQRRGLDNNDARIQSIVHPVRLQDARTASPDILGALYANAFYSRLCRCIVYGEGLPAGLFSSFPGGVRNFATALDVVAHELSHAVTDASSDLIYANESGALNEAFSDIMATGVEQYFQTPGSGTGRADYLLGEDLAPSGTALLRSMSNPIEYQQPDHYGDRFYIGATTSSFDDGGVHINSGIANNAFYLAIEGGTNRTSRRAVTGVGATNREQLERAFYRAFTSMLPSNGTFYLARVATIQAARDLYGAGSAADRAIADAWDAVGVSSPGAAVTNSFSPRRVDPSSLSCGGASPSFTFRLSLREFQNVGFTVSNFTAYILDSQGRLIREDQYDSAAFRSLFNQCQAGSTRIGPGATACATLCTSLGGRSTGYAQFTFFGTDDNGNKGIFDTDYVSFGLPAINESADPTTFPTLTKGVRR